MLEGFQERQALEMSHVSHMHRHPSSLPSGSAGDGQHNLCWVLLHCLGIQDPLLLLSHPFPQQLLGQLHGRQGARIAACYRRAERKEGGQLEGCQREETAARTVSLERCDSSSSPFPLWEIQTHTPDTLP